MSNDIVYVLTSHDWDNTQIVYIFKTPELREEYIKKYPKKRWYKEDHPLITDMSHTERYIWYPKEDDEEDD